ncbi:MAG: GNAT family N-acetyltransferase [Planctomycetota bacterium]
MTQAPLPEIRPTRADDLAGLEAVVAQTKLFPPEMLAGMVDEPPAPGDPAPIWLTALEGCTPVGLCFARAETFTTGTWNLLAMAVAPARQGRGIGTALLCSLERRLKADGARILIIDTMGTEAFTATRAFYLGCGYVQEAVLRDFWDEGADKVTFWKKL